MLRGDDLHKHMSIYLVGRVQAADNVEVLYHTEIQRMLGNEMLEAVDIENRRARERSTLATQRSSPLSARHRAPAGYRRKSKPMQRDLSAPVAG